MRHYNRQWDSPILALSADPGGGGWTGLGVFLPQVQTGSG